jgi:hypothetical protein
MRFPMLLPIALLMATAPGFGQTPAPTPAPSAAGKDQAAASADVKVGLGLEKYELTGAAETFKVAAGTKIYAWTKVTGATDGITIVFAKDGKTVFQQKLEVKASPYRTNAYRTFRAGDAGAWTAKVLGADGTELGSAAFTVEIT